MHRLGYQLVQDANGFDFESLSPAMPTLIVHGTQDEVIPVDTVRAWAARRNGVRLVELPGGDHSLQTCFDLLWQESREFLEE
jgi:pimeloyl-ACP methyl ester carboxylesterase